jgi:nucleoside-diphosphate-sugar epimerase
MKIVVLGGGGFIGCNLTAYLKDQGHWVRVVDEDFPEFREKMWGQADEIVVADLRSYQDVYNSLCDIDWVVQLAADMGGVGYFHGGNDYYPYLNSHQINLNVLHAIEKHGIERMFFSASACIYPTHLNDKSDSPALTEEMIYPANCDMSYGWEKLMMLRLCERAPFSARVGIFDTIYGVYQEMEGERMKFPTAIATKVLKASKDDSEIEIWGDGTQQRVFLYIDDAVRKIYRILASEHYEGPVNVASETEVNVTQVAEMCCEIVGDLKLRNNFKYLLDKPMGVMSRRTDGGKFDRVYGAIKETTPEEGFTKLISWLKGL